MRDTQKTKKQTAPWRIVLLSLAGVLLGLSIYSWNARAVLGNQMPMPFGFGMATVLSGSMEPTLSVNDLVVIRETRTVEAGDIVVFQSGSALVIHRVVEVRDQEVITQGDANNAPDDPVHLNRVKGKLVLTIPGLGAAVALLRKPAAILILLAAAVALTELSYRKEKNSGQKELDALQEEINDLIRELREEQ